MLSQYVRLVRCKNKIYWRCSTQHYKTIAYGAILVAIALALCKPTYLVVNTLKDPKKEE